MLVYARNYCSIFAKIVETNIVATLEIEGNKLTGSIPSQIGNLVALNVITLGGNELMGSIPTEIGNCVLLKTFNLGQYTLIYHV